MDYKTICAILIFVWMIVRCSDGLFSLMNWLIEYLVLFPIRIICEVLFGYDD